MCVCVLVNICLLMYLLIVRHMLSVCCWTCTRVREMPGRRAGGGQRQDEMQDHEAPSTDQHGHPGEPTSALPALSLPCYRRLTPWRKNRSSSAFLTRGSNCSCKVLQKCDLLPNARLLLEGKWCVCVQRHPSDLMGVWESSI